MAFDLYPIVRFFVQEKRLHHYKQEVPPPEKAEAPYCVPNKLFYRVFKSFSGCKFWDFSGSNLDGHTGLWVSPCPGLPF